MPIALAGPVRAARRAALILSLASPVHAQQAGWTPLFDGRTLDGWYACNGSAPFTVEEGTITGRSVVGSPNSFLCTRATYGDFVFEFEMKQDSPLNSGVQVRSIVDPLLKNGRVHGYQLDIDPTDRRWTGGIYDESRRGWLHSLTGQPAAQRAYRFGQWNRFRIEAIGTSIRTFVNGIPAADIIDDLTPSGIIALQVHDIGQDTSLAGRAVWFRNLRIRTTQLAAARTPARPGVPQFNHIPNTLTTRERAEGWTMLWDGSTSAGWRASNGAPFPAARWEMQGGMLTLLDGDGRGLPAGGDIVTEREYENYELLVEYRLTRGANSGIKYFVTTLTDPTLGFAVGCEFQLLDDARHPDAKLGLNGNRTNAGLYDLIPPASRRFNGIEEWNQARIIVRGAHVEHWLNGFKTVEYERGTQLWRALVRHSKYAAQPAFGEATRGRILLQDHGNRVSFRSIKLRELPSGVATTAR